MVIPDSRPWEWRPSFSVMFYHLIFPTRRETSFTWIFDICEFFSSRVNAVGWPCGLAGSVVALDVQRNPKLRRVRYLHTAPGPGNQCLDFSQLGKRDGKNCH